MLRLEPHLQSAQHVIWDWNGTLLSDLHHTISTVNKFLADHQLPILDETTYRQKFGFPIRKYYEDIGFRLNDEEFQKLCVEFVDLYMSKVFECSLFPGVKDLLGKIKGSGKTQSILSASDQQSLTTMVEFHGLTPYLNYAYGIADKFAASKVSRGKELILHSGIDPKDTVLLGDTDHDLEVGESLGVSVILLAQGHQNAEKLRKLHHTVIEF